MAQEIDFADPEIKALEAWLKRSLSTMGKSAAGELGCTLDIDIKALALKTEEEIRSQVPSDGLSWGLKLDDSEGHFFVLCGRKVALAVSRPADDGEGALAERLADEAPFSDDEKAAMMTAQQLLSQSLIDAVKGDCSNDNLASHHDIIEGSAWASGQDPIGAESFLVAEINVRYGGEESEASHVVLSATFIREHFAQALEAKSGSSASGSFVFYPASSPMKDHIVAQLGAEPQECETIAELMRGFLDEDVSGAVIGVNKGEEHILSLLRGMKELPDCGDKHIIVVLENPSTSNVVRCGRLGLFSVLPPEFSPNDIQKKLSRPE
ncbi:MAG: hypothetical protein ACI97A_000058 [Planctomycetota bacterium]|jgi:hypothetical protein